MNQSKKILCISLILFTIACSRETDTFVKNSIPENHTVVNRQSLILADTYFQAMIKGQLVHYARVVDLVHIKKVMADNKITQEEYRLIPGYHGYSSVTEFEKYYLLLNNQGQYLNAKYGFKNMSADDQFATLKAGFDKELGVAQNLVDASCESIRQNCLANVAAQATLMHLGCISADLTLFGGILCHSAAFLYQVTSSSNCNTDYDKCTKQNSHVN